MSEESSSQLLEGYLNDSLTAEEKILFENEMKNNKELRDQVDLHNETDIILDDMDWGLSPANTSNPSIDRYREFLQGEQGQSTKHAVQNVADKYFDQNDSSEVSGRSPWFGSAIAAAFFLMAVGLVFLFNKRPSSHELYEVYSDHHNLPSFTNRNTATLLSDIEVLYQQERYEEAIKLLDEYEQRYAENFNPQIYLYKGNMQIILNQENQALETFNRLQLSNSLDSDKAYWYKAMTYMKLDDKTHALEELEKLVASPSNFKRVEALKLLDKLD